MLEQLSLFQQLTEAVQPKNLVDKITGQTSSAPVPKNLDRNLLYFMGEPIEVIRRPYQRSISVLVRPSGKIRVTCARLTTKKAILKFLNEHHTWLRKSIDEQRKLREAHPPKSYEMGEDFLYLGSPVYLNFSPTTQKKLNFSIQGDQLVAFIPQDQWTDDYMERAHPELKDPLIQFYKNSGKKTLQLKVKQVSDKMGLCPRKVTYRAQKTRWGSCTSQGHVSLNWKLIAAPMGTLEYVIIHELAHLEYQNHSKVFWSLVQRYCADHKSHRRWLRDHQFEFDFLMNKSELYDA